MYAVLPLGSTPALRAFSGLPVHRMAGLAAFGRGPAGQRLHEVMEKALVPGREFSGGWLKLRSSPCLFLLCTSLKSVMTLTDVAKLGSDAEGLHRNSSRRALALAVTIQFVQVAIRAPPGCTNVWL